MKNFTMLFSMLLISAFSFGQTVIFSEDFDGQTMPSGWSTINVGGGSGTYDWSFGTGSFGWEIQDYDFDSNAALFNDDEAGEESTHDKRLLRHEGFDASNYSNLVIGFEYSLRQFDDKGILKISIFNQNSNGWQPLQTYHTTTSPISVELDLETFLTTNSIDRSNLRIGFIWNDEGEWSFGAGVNDVYVAGIAKNDDCAMAYPIEVQDIFANCTNPVIADNTNATGSEGTNGTPDCYQYNGGDVWFSFVAPSNGAIDLTVPTVAEWSSMAHTIYNSCGATEPITECKVNLNINNPANIPSVVTYQGLTPGQTYYLRAWDMHNDSPGMVSFCLKESDECLALTNLNLDEYETNYVYFDWTNPNYDQTYKEWQIRRTSDNVVVREGTGLVEDYLAVYNLTSATEYELRIRNECDQDFYSEWTSLIFTTDACVAPEDLTISNITTDGFTAQWYGYSPFSWSVTKGAATILSGTDAHPPLNISGLSPSEEPYVFNVWTVCGNNLSSYISSDGIHLQEEVSCLTPTNLIADDYEDTWIAFTWEDQNTEPAYWDWNLVRTADNVEVASGNGMANPEYFQITGLTSGTEYRLNLRAECQADDYSTWVSATNATTDCVTPSFTGISNISQTGFTASWATGEPINYFVTNNGNTVVSGTALGTESAVDITGLTPGETYVFHIAKECGDNLSDYINSDEITLEASSVDDLHLAGYSAFTVSPNPTTNKLTIAFSAKEIDEATITVSTVFGQVVKQLPVQIKKGENKHLLDLTVLNAGVYFIAISNENGIMSKRIVKY